MSAIAPDTAPRPPRRWAAHLPLAAVWLAASVPVVLFLLHRRDPELAVRVAIALKQAVLYAALALVAAGCVAALSYPPFPAWIRRFVERTRTAWSVDRAPLMRALSELQHLETAQRHFEVARLAWIRGDLELVGQHVTRAVQLDPEMASAQHLLGLYLLRLGAVPLAHQAFSLAEQLDPGHAFGDALLHAARTADIMGQNDLALELFERHRRAHGDSPRSNYWYGEALLATGRHDEARQAFAAAARDPGTRLTAEENWFRALAQVKLRRLGGST